MEVILNVCNNLVRTTVNYCEPGSLNRGVNGATRLINGIHCEIDITYCFKYFVEY